MRIRTMAVIAAIALTAALGATTAGDPSIPGSTPAITPTPTVTTPDTTAIQLVADINKVIGCNPAPQADPALGTTILDQTIAQPLTNAGFAFHNSSTDDHGVVWESWRADAGAGCVSMLIGANMQEPSMLLIGMYADPVRTQVQIGVMCNLASKFSINAGNLDAALNQLNQWLNDQSLTSCSVSN